MTSTAWLPRILFFSLIVINYVTVEAQNPDLSPKSIGILNSIKEETQKDSLSTKCQNGLKGLMGMAGGDEMVLNMCNLIKMDVAKVMVKKQCSQNEYEKLVITVCKVINAADKDTDEDKDKDKIKIDPNLSKEASTVLSNIINDLENLSRKCTAFVSMLVHAMKTDESVYRLCKDVSAPSSKATTLTYCTEEEYNQIKESTCEEIKKSGKHNTEDKTSSNLSKEANAIMNSVKNKLNSALSDKCKPMIDLAAGQADTDDKVFGMCKSIETYKSIVVLSCSQDDFDTIKKTICDEIKASKTNNTEVNKNPNLSQEAATVLNNIVSDLKNLSSNCTALVSMLVDAMKTDESVYRLCKDVSASSSKATTLTYCTEEEYNQIKESTCEEIKKSGKHNTEDKTSSNLSKEANAIMNSVKNKLNSALSDKCKPMIDLAAGQADTDDKVFGMCKSIETYKSIVLSACSQDDFDTIKKTICDEIEASGRAGITKAPAMSREAQDVIENIKQDLKDLSGVCKEVFISKITVLGSDAEVIQLCEDVKKGAVSSTLSETCAQNDFKQIKTSTCNEVKILNQPGKCKDSGHKAWVSTVLKNMMRGLKDLSTNCQTLIEQTTGRATYSILKGLCESLKGPAIKGLIATKCNNQEYVKISKTVCDVLKSSKSPSSECTTSSTTLSSEANDTLLHITNDLQQMSQKCKSTVMNLAKNANTDMKVHDLCQDVKKPSAEITIKQTCTDEEYNQIKASTCKQGKKLSQTVDKKLIHIGKTLYFFSDACKKEVGELSSMATFEQINNLCDDISKNKAAAFKKSCPGEHYTELKDAVCGSAVLLSGCLSLVLSVLVSLLFKYL